MASEALTIENLVAGYGPSTVLHSISLRVPPGERVAVLGPNGAGKTTLLRAISGLVKPRAGEISFGKQRIGGLAPDQIVALGIAHVPEGRQVFPEFTVRENLRVAAFVRRGVGFRASLDQVLDTFPPLKARLDVAAGLLSGGEQQMLALGRAIVQQPKLVVIDEMSLGLAPFLVKELFGRLRDLFPPEIGMVIVEQNPRMAINHCTYVYVMRAGQIQGEGKPEEFASADALAKAYLGEVSASSHKQERGDGVADSLGPAR